MYKEKSTGLWCRENTLDEYIIKEQRSYNPLLSLVKNKVVMDIGSNIGAFAYSALVHGASSVVCFEPDPDNIKVFRKQDLDGATLYTGAIAQKSGEAYLYLNAGKNKGMHSLQHIQGRERILIKTYSFRKALKKFKPDYIKMDIEGGEFELDLSDIPDFVKGIAIEIHLNHKDNRKLAEDLIQDLEEQFPKVLKQPNITDKNWTTLFIGRR